MPQRKSDLPRLDRRGKAGLGPPPPTMTWGKAAPVLVACLIFDAARFFFEQFWFFGPALAGIYCTNKVSGVIGMVWGLVPAACGAGATFAGYAFNAPLALFGVIMAICVGLLGWMTVGLMLILTNSRIFKENAGHAAWFVASLAISEMPIIGTVPALVVITWKMYSTQIKKEKAALAEYNKKKVALEAEERQEKTVQIAQYRAEQMAQAEQAAETEEEELAESPEELLKAA